MFDARIFPNSLDDTKKVLEEQGAVLKGEYEIHDYIFASTDPEQTLDKVFLRLRMVPVNIWNEKKVIVTIKNTELQKVGKKSIIPVKEQFDNEEDARAFIEKNYSDTFKPDFNFNRKGWQYNLPNGDQVDLEDIESHFSVEFKSKTEEELRGLLDRFDIDPKEVAQGPSVIVIRDWFNDLRHEEKFVNEFGNNITVRISERDIRGVKGVMIFIAGPTSDTENQITLMEAEIIYKQLGLLIKKMKQYAN